MFCFILFLFIFLLLYCVLYSVPYVECGAGDDSMEDRKKGGIKWDGIYSNTHGVELLAFWAAGVIEVYVCRSTGMKHWDGGTPVGSSIQLQKCGNFN